MKECTLAVVALLAAGGVHASTPEQELAEGQRIAASLSQAGRNLCVFDNGAPSNVPHQVIRKLKVAKGTYGGVKELLPKLVDEALANKADALADYNSSQRFGFWPWRVVRPVVTATAVRWTQPPKEACEAMGGVRMEVILTTNRSPEALSNAGSPSPDKAEAGAVVDQAASASQ